MSAGIRPFGGSTTCDVRRPAGFAEVNTALYAPATSCWLPRSARRLRPMAPERCASCAARSWSVKNSLFAFSALRSNGVVNSSSQIPWRSGWPHAVFGAGPVAAAVRAWPLEPGPRQKRATAAGR